MRQLTALQLHQYLRETATAPLLLDVREPWEIAICRIEGSKVIPMRQVPQAIESLDPRRETVVICHHGVRSHAVAAYLENAGFASVINLQGGVAAWARDVDADMPTY
jgi:rhodanese-related sulfurtransferase